MIYLKREVPHKLAVSEVLLRRGILSEAQEQFLNDVIWKSTIGYEGECYADKYWQDLRLSFPHALLHGFETTHRELFHHQMDTIFVCANFILITELKYIAGEIFYDEKLHQLWRIHNGQHLALGDPFAQVSRHEMWMTHFLREIDIDIPILTAVIVTAKSALLKQMPNRFHVFKLDGLSLKLQEWLDHYPQVIEAEKIQFIAEQLLYRHEPKRWDWQKALAEVELKDGAICECGNTMTYHQGKFICLQGHSSKHVLYEAMNDYRLLKGEWINNSQFRRFLGISSSNTAFKLLQKISVGQTGNNKSRKYRLAPNLKEMKR